MLIQVKVKTSLYCIIVESERYTTCKFTLVENPKYGNVLCSLHNFIMRKVASDKNAASSSEVKLTKMLSKLGGSEKSSCDVESIFERWDETRITIKKRLERSWIGLLYENTLLLMSVASCLHHIYSSYLDTLTDAKLIRTSDIVELVFASAFAFDWVLSFCLADHKVMFCYR